MLIPDTIMMIKPLRCIANIALALICMTLKREGVNAASTEKNLCPYAELRAQRGEQNVIEIFIHQRQEVQIIPEEI